MTKNRQYYWKGMLLSGEATRGIIDANSPVLAKIELRKQGIIALKIVKKRSFVFKKYRRIRALDITVFIRQLTTLIKAGITLNHSFNLLSLGTNNPRMKTLIRSIQKDVEGGLMFSQALGKHPVLFNPLCCSMIKAGEQSGTLETMLLKVIEYRESTASFRKNIQKTMAYPIAVTIIAMMVTGILLTCVIPQFDSLFKSFGAELPTLTQYVIHLSSFFRTWWPMIVFMILSVIYGGIYAHKHSPKCSNLTNRLFLELPMIGKIARKSSISRFTRTLSITCAAGLSLTEALQSVADVTGAGLYAQAANQIREDILQGQSMHYALKNTQLFPEMVIQLISVGEESGSLEQMLSKIADFYEEDVNTALETLSSLLEPIIMTVLGLSIGGLVVAMYLPILKLGSII